MEQNYTVYVCIEDTVPQLEGKVEKSHEDEMMSTDHSKGIMVPITLLYIILFYTCPNY